MSDYKNRIGALRTAMKQADVDGFIVPRGDEWQGEFVAPYAERLLWISGFTGSGGCAVILQDKAAAFTDGRYMIQIVDQVDSTFYECVDMTKFSVAQWTAENVPANAVIGYDSRLHTPKQIEAFKAEGVALRAIDNLIDCIWRDQPERPSNPIDIFPDEIAGMSVRDKCTIVGDTLNAHNIEHMILTLPDSICWLLNIRGHDTRFIPQVLSYAVIDKKGRVTWFMQSERVPEALKECVDVVDPEYMQEHLKCLDERVGLDFVRSPDWFRLCVEGCEIVDFKDPCIAPKAKKTPSEQMAIKHAHIDDGVALSKFLAWLAREGAGGGHSEISVSEKLEHFRCMNEHYKGASFPTIAGFGANGAVIHYRATQRSDKKIDCDGVLLIDSGGQYHYGTTDITRTIAIGTPSIEVQENFTRVLQGHIDVARARFDTGTLGKEIDALARAPLQDVGLDFAHGTGHGVGCYLAVHEEAASLSPRGEEALEEGMLVSNEPGYYKEGAYGIRIENLILVCRVGDQLEFETVSFAPIDRHLIVTRMLSPAQRDWVDHYHAQCLEILSPALEGEDLSWLEGACAPLD